MKGTFEPIDLERYSSSDVLLYEQNAKIVQSVPT